MPYITHGWPRLRTAAKGAAPGAVTRLSYTCSVEIREERIAIVFVIPPFERREDRGPRQLDFVAGVGRMGHPPLESPPQQKADVL